jgi:predicted translation initiation factor SUI1
MQHQVKINYWLFCDGFKETDADLKKIASTLKNRCGTGGSVKDEVSILQGDHRETLKTELTKQGYRVKLAGGRAAVTASEFYRWHRS